MSRIGKKPIDIPDDIEIKIDGNLIMIKGPKGELIRKIHPAIKIEKKDNKLIFSIVKEIKKASALWGLFRVLVANMIQGVKYGFEKKLEIEGIGYKAQTKDNKLILELGFSHPVEILAPNGIQFKVEKNIITVSGIDKELVGRIAAIIRSKRKPEPYKGKGIRYQNEVIRRKAGKKALTTA